jgi:hypothetical protein
MNAHKILILKALTGNKYLAQKIFLFSAADQFFMNFFLRTNQTEIAKSAVSLLEKKPKNLEKLLETFNGRGNFEKALVVVKILKKFYNFDNRIGGIYAEPVAGKVKKYNDLCDSFICGEMVENRAYKRKILQDRILFIKNAGWDRFPVTLAYLEKNFGPLPDSDIDKIFTIVAGKKNVEILFAKYGLPRDPAVMLQIIAAIATSVEFVRLALNIHKSHVLHSLDALVYIFVKKPAADSIYSIKFLWDFCCEIGARTRFENVTYTFAAMGASTEIFDFILEKQNKNKPFPFPPLDSFLQSFLTSPFSHGEKGKEEKGKEEENLYRRNYAKALNFYNSG